MIPQILHQMWLDKNDDEGIYPEKYTSFVNSFKEKNPNYEYKLWNMKMVNELFESDDLVKYKKFFNNLNHHIEKCDFARYALLYKYGGLYCDLDFKFNKNLDPLLNRNLLLVLEPKEHSLFFNKLISNGFLGSIQYNHFWLGLMDHIMKTYNNLLSTLIPVINTTGPMKLGSYFFSKNIDNSSFIPTYYAFPYNIYNRKSTEYRENEAYIETYWSDGTNWSNDIFLNILKKDIIPMSIFFIFIISLLISLLKLIVNKYILS